MSCTSLTIRRPIPADYERTAGRPVVRAVTGPVNAGSIVLHTSLGFAILPGDEEVDGLRATVDHGPQGDHVVRFELRLDGAGGE